jgi:hypothetical protein
METRKEFIYRMLAMISEVQDKPNISTKDITSMLELHLHNREREVAVYIKDIALRKYEVAGLHKHSYTKLDHLFKLILTKI